ncbi:hypothetical protein HFP89_07700 [Wenzhouxiangella sp. XN79A]|uniref:hypothetical protein n=1 Tax=Wenzhouxiangella sp. XN79A TaxID=2724193 RepID=UPI00144AAC6A|nr:hypothetical protein [Wenzhouxiangella sp. XN79A]NKI35047.1 hypothetical protein [Wenzhouxiangella sp. XN79A]
MSAARTDAERLRRLRALGVEVWLRRDRPAPDAALPAEDESHRAAADVPRIRLAPGRGRWLLLGEGTERPDCRALLDDLRGLLGAEACRFGQWSDSPESGVAAEDWAERGIEWVLDFGGPGAAHPAVLNLPRLDELTASAEARKRLWQALRPLLETD